MTYIRRIDEMGGMVCAIEASATKLDDIRRSLTEAAPVVARAISAEMDREAHVRRVAELELVYELGSIATGAAGTTTYFTKRGFRRCDLRSRRRITITNIRRRGRRMAWSMAITRNI